MGEAGQIIDLPKGETPAVFDITDPQSLISQQAFFTNAQKGDKLIVYPQSGKAIIYSPERKRVINAGPVTFNQPTATSTKK